MKSNLSNATLTEQVAQAIEGKIYSGDFPANTALPSTRKLAESFGVSQRVVLSALDVLESKDIVCRQERKRVYVKAKVPGDNSKEVLFFAFGNEIGLHGIYQAVNDMILNQPEDCRYDYFSRIVSSAVVPTRERLDREIARLGNIGFVDCALFYFHMDQDSMQKCHDLPYPVIFLGEMPDDGFLPPQARLISTGSWRLLLCSAEYAVRRGFRTLAIAFWQEIAQRKYEREAFEKLERYAAEHYLKLKKIPVSGKNVSEVRTNFSTIARQAALELPEKTLLAAHNLHSESFENRSLITPDEFPELELLTLTIPTPGCRIKTVDRDYANLKTAIRRFINNPEDFPCGKQIDTDCTYQVN